MDVLTLVALIGAVVALALQAASCFFSERPVSIGLVDLILAAATGWGAVAMISGDFVIATDVGMLLAQGTSATWLLRLSLVASGALPAICFWRIWELNRGNISAWWPIVAGIAVGTVAASQVRLLNPADVELLHIRAYDAFSPPLIIWLTACFAASVFALTKAIHRLTYVLFVASIVTPLATFIQRWPTTADHAGMVWAVLERASFTVAAFCFAWRLLETFGTSRPSYARLARWMSIPTAIAFVFAFLPLPSWLSVSLGALPLALLTISIVAFVLESQSRPEAPGSDGRVMAVRQAASKTVPIGRVRGLVLSLALPIVALGLIDLLAIGAMPRAVSVAVIFLFWILLAERLAEGALDTLPELLTDCLFQLPIVKRTAGALRASAAAARQAIAATLGLFKGDTGWAVAAKAALATIVSLLLVAVLAEIVTYRPIVVTSFQWIGPADAKEEARAKAVSALLINALGRLRNDLRTDLRNASVKRSGDDREESLLAAGVESTALEATVAKSDDVKIGNVSVPVQFFFRPIQSLVRSALGVRVVRGELWKTSDDHSVIMMNVSDGESWQVDIAAASEAPDQPEHSACNGHASEVTDATTAAVERLAYRIASTDPLFLAAGLTKNYDAFLRFRRGIGHWDTYENGGRRASLRKAIECFRQAVDLDRQFAAGHFRLGAALRSDGQPRSAVASFRLSTAGNLAFIPAALQEAATLYNLSDYALPSPAVLATTDDEGQSREEARMVWNRILALPAAMVSASDRRAALYGICDHEFRAAGSRPDRDYLVPYFFCSRAEALWPWVPQDPRDSQEHALEADLLGILGVILDAHHGNKRFIAPDSWACAADQIDDEIIDQQGQLKMIRVTGSPRTRIAMRYYRRSLAMRPDNTFVRCRLASAVAYRDEDLREMRSLSQSLSARLDVASQLTDAAGRWAKWQPTTDDDRRRQTVLATFYYRRAIAELSHAVSLDQSSVNALDDYAYTVWKWSLDALERTTTASPGAEVLRTAERYAREAVRIAGAWRHSADVRAATSATLGEILLAQGRPQEAIQHLEPLLNEEWSSVNEVRWDLAQAKLCAAIEADRETADDLRRKAVADFTRILDTERGHEAQPFTMAMDRFGAGRRPPICAPSPDAVSLERPAYEFAGAQYGSALICDSSEVSGVIAPETPDANVHLHVWGGGMDNYVPVGSNARWPIGLESPRQHRQRYYFARLENDDGAGVSPTVSIETFARKDANDCTRSAITLVFAPHTAQAPAVRNAGGVRKSAAVAPPRRAARRS